MSDESTNSPKIPDKSTGIPTKNTLTHKLDTPAQDAWKVLFMYDFDQFYMKQCGTATAEQITFEEKDGIITQSIKITPILNWALRYSIIPLAKLYFYFDKLCYTSNQIKNKEATNGMYTMTFENVDFPGNIKSFECKGQVVLKSDPDDAAKSIMTTEIFFISYFPALVNSQIVGTVVAQTDEIFKKMLAQVPIYLKQKQISDNK